MSSEVEEIKSRLNIVDVVGEYIRLNKAGANWKGLCPFHHEKSPSFMVHEEKQIYHCFGCNKGGDVFSFVMEMESLDFRETLKMLAEKAGVQLSSRVPQQRTDDKKIILEILELATKFYETQLWNGVGKDKIMAYLRERGLSDESIKSFRLGFAPGGWRNALDFLVGRGYSVRDIEKTGLIIKKEGFQERHYDRFRDRIMFPICDSMGKVIGYSARVAPGGDESQAKYINTPETSVYHKSNVLYGLHLAKQSIKQKDAVLLVEGNMDVIASHQAGIRNTVAVSGTALTPQQIDTLKRYASTLQLLFDMDSAGTQALKRSADLAFTRGANVVVVRLAEGKDAADVVQKDPGKLVEAVDASMSAMEYFFQSALSEYQVRDPLHKKQFVQELGLHVAHMGNQIEKMHWIKKIAHEIDAKEEVVFDVISSLGINETQREDRNMKNAEDDETFAERSEVVRNKLVGIMMSNSEAWKWCDENYSQNEYLQEDQFLQRIFVAGRQFGYKFDDFVFSIEDENMRQRLGKLLFEAKYQFSDANSVSERDSNETKEMAYQYVLQIIKELQKQKLRSIIRDIKSAEQSGDRQKLGVLMSEFTKLSQELT
jgi:DNA primase